MSAGWGSGYVNQFIYTPTGPDYGENPFALATIDLAQATHREAELLVRNSANFFRPRVIRFGKAERALSGPPPTLPIINGAEIDVADNNGYFRNLLYAITQRRRPIEIRIGFKGGEFQQFPVLFGGELDKSNFGPGYTRLKPKDIWKRWMDRRCPPWINLQNFPNLPEGITSGFFPLVFGQVYDLSTNPQGAIELPLVDTTLNRYAANRTQTKAIPRVYRKEPGDGVFTLVSDTEYSVVEVVTTIDAYPGYHLTYVQFNSAQPDGTLIRADIDGTSFRGTFLNLPEIPVGTTIRNPVDHVINLLFFLLILEGSTAAFDDWAFYDTWQKYADLALYSDIAFTEDITIGEMLSRITYSAMMNIYPNRHGRIAVNFTALDETNDDRQVFTDDFDILRNGRLRGSESQLDILIDDIERTVNQFEHYWGWNNSTQQWSAGDFYNNAADQSELGEIEHDIFYFYAIRNTATMRYMIRLLASYYRLKTKLVKFYLSGPKNVSHVELALLIGMKYYLGPGGPWTNKELQVRRIAYDGQRHEMYVEALTMPEMTCCPVPRAIGSFIPGDEFCWSHNSRVGPYMAPASGCEFDETFVVILRDPDDFTRLNAWLSDDMGATWAIADAAGFPSMESTIVSHDSHEPDTNGDVLVAAKLFNGRCVMFKFNLNSASWTLVNETVNQPDTVIEAPGHAFAPADSSARINLGTPITLGTTSTLFGWYKLTSPIDNYNPIWGSDGSNEIYYGSGVSSGKVAIVKAGATIFQSTASVVLNAWRLLIIVDTGTELKAYYSDGAGSLVDMGNSVGAYTSLSGMSISRTNQGVNGNNFSGFLDEIGIFNNRVLDATARNQLLNGEAGLYGNTTVAPFSGGSLSVGYRLDEGDGTTAADYSGNGNNGTLVVESWGVGHVNITGSTLYDATHFVDGAISIAPRNNGEIAIAYDSEAEEISSTRYSRCLMRVRDTAGVWSDAYVIGRTGQSQHSQVQRVIAGDAGRLHVFERVTPGFFVTSTPDFEFVTLLGDNTLGAITTWHFSGLLGTSDRFYIGTYDTYRDPLTNALVIALPVRIAGEGVIVSFNDQDVIVPAIPGATGPTIWYGSESSLKPSYACKYTDALQQLWFIYGLASTLWIEHNTAGNQAGPVMPIGSPREFDAGMWLVDEATWLATLLQTENDGLKFELLNAASLPTSPTLLFEDWKTSLTSQDETFTESCHNPLSEDL